MKKLCLVLILALLFSTVCGFAEGIDLSGMSSDELIALSIEVQKAIDEKGSDIGSFMYPGMYIVGKDIDEGEYVLSVIRFPKDGDVMASVYVFEDEDASKEELESFGLEIGDEHRIKVSDGNMIYIKRGVLGYVKRS